MPNEANIYLADSRWMPELADGAVDLAVTSPPYWHLKDYGVPGQIGYGQSLHEYLGDLYRTWAECFRVLREGGRLCINVGDQFARAAVYGRYKVIPLHAEIILQGEQLGFDFLGAIIWQKKTTLNTTGGAPVMGSYPFPPNGLVEIDYEFILIFKKPGAGKRVAAEIKAASRLSREEWKEYFAGHWRFAGAKQVGHEAMFPEELPRRLIRMFSWAGDTVLDPFAGSGTTVKAALELGRTAVGYEINRDFVPLMEQKVRAAGRRVEWLPGAERPADPAPADYIPRLPEARPEAVCRDFSRDQHPKVIDVLGAGIIRLDTGQVVQFLGVQITREAETRRYLETAVAGRRVILKGAIPVAGGPGVRAYVYLTNKIFINAYLIKAGLANPDPDGVHKHHRKFVALWEQRREHLELGQG